MISWIQKYFQRHFRLVFVLILLAMAVPLIVIYSGSSGLGHDQRRSTEVQFFGLNLASQADQQKLFGEAQVSLMLRMGYQGFNEGQIQQYAFFRQAALSIADELHMPAATNVELTEYVKKLGFFAGENGEFDAKKYNDFRTSQQPGRGDLSHILSDDVRVERVQKLVGGPGYVLAPDVKKQLERADSTWTLGVATVDFQSFNPPIKPTDAQIAAYFEQNPEGYRIPPKMVVNYVEIPASQFLPKITVTDAELKAVYEANPGRFPKPEAKADEKKPATPNPDADFAAVRPQVEAAFKADRAARAARHAGDEFAKQLLDTNAQPGTPQFNALLAARGLSLKEAPAFSREEAAGLFGNSPDAATEAFKLGKERLYSDPVSSISGTYILFWKGSIDARQPELNEVKAKVAADFTAEEKRRLFIALGNTLKNQLQSRVKAGDTFEKAVAAVAATSPAKIEQKTYTPFTLRQPPQDISPVALRAIENLSKGSVSDMTAAGDKGYLVYAADKKLPDLTEASPAFQSTRAEFAQELSTRVGAQYLNEMVTAELAKTRQPQP